MTTNMDNAPEGDIRRRAFILSRRGSSPLEIAHELGEDVANIYPLLKEAQKEFVAKERVQNHARKKNNS